MVGVKREDPSVPEKPMLGSYNLELKSDTQIQEIGCRKPYKKVIRAYGSESKLSHPLRAGFQHVADVRLELARVVWEHVGVVEL